MRHRFLKTAAAGFTTAWIVALAIGAAKLWSYDGTAGPAAQPPKTWPSASHIFHTPGSPALLVFIHPKCPCSRATIGELAKLMTHCPELAATVVVIHPAKAPADWLQTDLCTDAASIPHVTLFTDDEGKETHRFGAGTSGQTLFYDAGGRLLFAGGITESRGHSGDNAGESAIMSLDLHPTSNPVATILSSPVYGCSLFDTPDSSQQSGGAICQP
ncbi:MAG TPA: RedB protein [Phycisphaerae bacterium]